ncbi:G-type lectin S-receptor-like serine/threonine-protein kinase [Tanacetum coccineum]
MQVRLIWSPAFGSSNPCQVHQIVLINESKSPVWSTYATSTSGLNYVVAVILDDGNLILTDGLNSAELVWQSFDHPVQTVFPGAKVAYDKRRNESIPLTSWNKKEDPVSGLYSLELHPVLLMIYTDDSDQFKLHTWSDISKRGIHWLQPDNQCHCRLSEDNFNGKTMYIKVASKDLASHKKNKTLTIAIVIGSVASGILVIGLLVYINYRRKRMLAGKTSMEGSLVAFGYRDLQLATKNFSEKLGGGGFGSVFNGVLHDSSIVAVKKLESISQGEKQFRSEVSTIGTIQHVNLVRLCGFCAEGNDKLLVYDYMPNGSLHSHLFHEKQENVLNWKTRFIPWDLIVDGDLQERLAPAGDNLSSCSSRLQTTNCKGYQEGFGKLYHCTKIESLDKAYDRSKNLSQLEVHAAPVSKEDINQKFLRSLPPSWSQIALIMRNKPDIDQTDIDDLYNNLRVYEDEMKKFVTASGNFGVNTAGGTSSTSQVSSTPGADEVVCSFFAQQITSPPLDNEDLQQID